MGSQQVMREDKDSDRTYTEHQRNGQKFYQSNDLPVGQSTERVSPFSALVLWCSVFNFLLNSDSNPVEQHRRQVPFTGVWQHGHDGFTGEFRQTRDAQSTDHGSTTEQYPSHPPTTHTPLSPKEVNLMVTTLDRSWEALAACAGQPASGPRACRTPRVIQSRTMRDPLRTRSQAHGSVGQRASTRIDRPSSDAATDGWGSPSRARNSCRPAPGWCREA